MALPTPAPLSAWPSTDSPSPATPTGMCTTACGWASGRDAPPPPAPLPPSGRGELLFGASVRVAGDGKSGPGEQGQRPRGRLGQRNRQLCARTQVAQLDLAARYLIWPAEEGQRDARLAGEGKLRP